MRAIPEIFALRVFEELYKVSISQIFPPAGYHFPPISRSFNSTLGGYLTGLPWHDELSYCQFLASGIPDLPLETRDRIYTFLF
jgi:hypothetical protein